MKNLLKMEIYQLSRNWMYWCSSIGIVLLGFVCADSYLFEEVTLTDAIERKASTLLDVFDRMVYDSTFLLIILSCLLAFILDQEFKFRTISQELTAGHAMHKIFISKILVYLVSFNLLILLYPIGGCVFEFSHFGVANIPFFFYHVIKVMLYSFLLNSATFLIAVLFCFALRSTAKAITAATLCVFILSLYLAYGLLLKLPVWFLPAFQI